MKTTLRLMVEWVSVAIDPTATNVMALEGESGGKNKKLQVAPEKTCRKRSQRHGKGRRVNHSPSTGAIAA
jgi:hypothetical protein